MLYQPKLNYHIITERNFPQQIDEIISTISAHSEKGTLQSFDGLTLNYEYILVENAIGNVVIMHGYTEFLQKYYETAWYMMNMGYNVFMYDQRGHGMSGREIDSLSFAHVYFFNDYVRDLRVIMTQLVNEKAPKLPNHAFCHSMGGSVLLLYLQQYPTDFKRVILSSPLIVPYTYHVPLSSVQRLAIKGLKENGPRSRFMYASDYNPNPPFKKSHDRSEARFRYNMRIRNSDAHYQNSTSTNRWIYESTKLYKKLLNWQVNRAIKTPVLILSAGKDVVVRTNHHRILAKQLSHSTYVYYRKATHSIYSGSDRQIAHYYKTIFRFLARR